MARNTRFDPFTEVDDFLKALFLRPAHTGFGEEQSLAQIRLDVSEDDQTYRVHAEMPGVRKEDIKVSIEGDVVSIRAEVKRGGEQKEGERIVRSERYYGALSRAFSLGTEIDESQCEAKYHDGVLELVLPKKAGGRARRIPIG